MARSLLILVYVDTVSTVMHLAELISFQRNLSKYVFGIRHILDDTTTTTTTTTTKTAKQEDDRSVYPR
uniref:Putative secreted protein n=1 Tax=Anopheles darlingi TaxID=43151 RepID=A0A2M4DGZ0_ANODA